MMFRLALVLFGLIATALAGSFVVVALTSGYDTGFSILVSAGMGAIFAVPVSWLIARRILSALESQE
jgi:hypothetical protein